MKISLVAAMGFNRVIGKDNAMPWRLPADLRHFKEVTMGKPVIMGRKTFESIGRALPGRYNIVVTRDMGYKAQGATVVHSSGEALAAAGEVDEVMIIGGQSLYEEFLPRAETLYLTLVEAQVQGDTFFPEYSHADWEELSREAHDADARNPYPFTFVVLRCRTAST